MKEVPHTFHAILDKALSLHARIEAMLDESGNAIVQPLRGTVEPLATANWCQKEVLPSRDVTQETLEQLILRYCWLLSHEEVGLALKREESALTVGIVHPDGCVCSRQEIEELHDQISEKVWLGPPRVVEHDPDDQKQDYFLWLCEKSANHQLILNRPVAHGYQARRHANFSAIRHNRVRRRHQETIRRDAMRRRPYCNGADDQLAHERGLETPASMSLSSIQSEMDEPGIVDAGGLLDATCGQLQ